jgi:hypothetical protein
MYLTISFIKYFSIIIISLFIYLKILNLKEISKTKIVLSILFSAFLSLVMFWLRIIIPEISIFIMVISTGIFIIALTKMQTEIVLTSIIICYAFGFFFFLLASIITISLSKILFGFIVNDFIIISSVFLFQGIFANIPFKFKRLKNGLPFLKNKKIYNFGVFISIILLIMVVVSSSKGTSLIYLLPLIGIILCAIAIIAWWRNNITKTYLERLKNKELEDAKNLVIEKDKKINELTKHNDFLSKIIHRDNKLIPALELAVKDFLISTLQNNSDENKLIGEQLLKQLETITKDRKGIIYQYQAENKQFPSTKIFSVDNLLTYLYHIAKEKQIIFDLILAANTKFIVESLITEDSLNTLLADLIENAFIAVDQCEYKKVLVSIGITENCYEIHIDDSGLAFEIDTLINLGIKKSTTHAHEGGSGIGLMSAFEIIKSIKASLTIEEYSNKTTFSFTKRISIRLDGKLEYIVKTYRTNEIKDFCMRSDVILIDTSDSTEASLYSEVS